jgi:hypothetical protein
LLVSGIENVFNMYIGVSTIPEVLANQPTCESDTTNNAPLLPEEGVAKTLEYVLVVLIGGDVICADKEVEQVKVN